MFVSYLKSVHFSIMGAINDVSIRQSEAQLRPKWPRTKTTTPPASSTPSTFAPSSFVGGVTLKAVMVQFQHMDARLDTLSDELCQVHACIGCIALRQARLGSFVASPSSSLKAFEDEDDDGDSDGDDEDEDEDARSSGDEEMTA